MDELATKLQTSARCMLGALKNDSLTVNEANEWYGYIRGIRDAAYDAGVLNQTDIQECLTTALEVIREKYAN